MSVLIASGDMPDIVGGHLIKQPVNECGLIPSAHLPLNQRQEVDWIKDHICLGIGSLVPCDHLTAATNDDLMHKAAHMKITVSIGIHRISSLAEVGHKPLRYQKRRSPSGLEGECQSGRRLRRFSWPEGSEHGSGVRSGSGSGRRRWPLPRPQNRCGCEGRC